MKAITISRQYGSGGGEIGARLAKRLNWHLIDHELVARVARELGIPEQQAEVQDEYAKGFIARVVSQFVSLHVFIEAPLQGRIAYVALRENLDAARARERIELKDGDRSRYFRTVLHLDADDPMLYDLVINTGVLSLDRAVDLIQLALEDKAQTLSLPPEALGPARGLARYRGQPADMRPPAHLTDTQPSS